MHFFLGSTPSLQRWCVLLGMYAPEFEAQTNRQERLCQWDRRTEVGCHGLSGTNKKGSGSNWVSVNLVRSIKNYMDSETSRLSVLSGQIITSSDLFNTSLFRMKRKEIEFSTLNVSNGRSISIRGRPQKNVRVTSWTNHTRSLGPISNHSKQCHSAIWISFSVWLHWGWK